MFHKNGAFEGICTLWLLKTSIILPESYIKASSTGVAPFLSQRSYLNLSTNSILRIFLFSKLPNSNVQTQ